MVERERRQILRVGFLAFASLAIFTGSVFLIGEQVRFWEKRSEYRIHFARTNGLLQGAPVSLSGVTVGSVSGMAFPENIHEMEKRQDLSDEGKRAIFSGTARRLYGLDG